MPYYSYIFNDDAVGQPHVCDFAHKVICDQLPNQFYRSGSIIISFLSCRTSEVKFDKNGTMYSWSEIDDKDSRIAITWDFWDSTRYGFTTMEPEFIFKKAVNGNLYCISIELISNGEAIALHNLFLSHDLYFGLVEIDIGNPIQVNLLWDLLFKHGDASQKHNSGIAPKEKEAKQSNVHRLSKRGKVSVMLVSEKMKLSLNEKILEKLKSSGTASVQWADVVYHTSSSAEIRMEVEKKLKLYCLNPLHPDGKHKALLFERLLAIDLNCWNFLACQLVDKLDSVPIYRYEANEYGVKYRAYLPVVGTNGVMKLIETGWIFEIGSDNRKLNSTTAKLITAFIKEDGSISEIDSDFAKKVIARPTLSRIDYSKLYNVAHEYALIAAAACTPTPMIIGSEVITDGLLGSTAILIKDARKGFCRWLIKEGIASHFPRKGAIVFSPAVGQSLKRAQEYAKEFAKILRLNQINCEIIENS
jgi:hypothetical protein